MIRCFFYALMAICLVVPNACQQNKAAPAATREDSAAVQNVLSEKKTAAIKNAAGLLQDGDLVMRSDNDFESLTLQNFSDSDRTYSHSGIAFKEEAGFVVYHSMTGIENPSGLCRKDPFDSFISPARKTGFGIFRYQLSPAEKETFHGLLTKNLAGKIPFDVTFNLKSDDSLYCSEMIYKGLKTATEGRIILPMTALHNFRPKILGYKFKQPFIKRFEYIALDNLYLNPFCKEITRITY